MPTTQIEFWRWHLFLVLTLIKEVIPFEQVTSIFQVIEKEWIAQWTEHQILKALFQYLIQMTWLYHSCSLKYLSFYIYFLFFIFSFQFFSKRVETSHPQFPPFPCVESGTFPFIKKYHWAIKTGVTRLAIIL